MDKIKRIIVFSDPHMLILCCVSLIACLLIYLVAILKTSKDIIILFSVAFILLLLSLLFTLSRWFQLYVFTAESIEYRTFIKKQVVIPYSQCYIYLTWYYHGTGYKTGSCRYFIVFSTRKLSNYEQSHINTIAADEVIKILYSKKTSRRIKSILSGQILTNYTLAETKLNKRQ